MGRRASSSLNATAIIGIVVVLLILIGVGAMVFRGKKESFAASPLPVSEFIDNANSFRGNEYTIEGKVFRREPRDTGLGVGLLVEEDGTEIPVFIVVPDEVSKINIERDISYIFLVTVKEGGVPVATDVKRL